MPLLPPRLTALGSLLLGLTAPFRASHASAQDSVPGRFLGKLAPCTSAGVDGRVLCGRFEVPENRARADARTISLNILVLPATTDSAAGDPVVFLAGGGVVPATRFARFLARAFPALRRTRDILLIDQRGTWNSNPLSCEPGLAPAGGAPPTADQAMSAALACRDALVQRADLRAYSTVAAVEDLDAVRAWLGYETINLYGVSYGTKAAQVYMRLHGGRVRAAALYGVVPVSVPSQLDLAGSAQTVLDLVFARCAADHACRTAFPGVAAEFDTLLARLTRQGVRVTQSPPQGAPQPVVLTDRTVRDLVQAMLGSRMGIERLPLAIHAAYGGDYTPFVTAMTGGGGPPPPPPAPRGVFYSLICSESISRVDSAAVASETRASFLGDAPVRFQMRVCAHWPRASMPNDFWRPVRVDVPVLALSGDLDPITPPRYGDHVVAALPRGTHVVLPNRSHNDVDPCITSLIEQFILAGGSDGLDTRCVTASPPLRFATRLGPGTAR